MPDWAGRIVAVLCVVLVAACAPALQPRGPDTASPRLEETHFTTRDGFELPLRIWKPDEPPRAIILALHGFNDYSNAFVLPGERLADRGVLVYAYDQRGFGAAPFRGRWPGGELLVQDAVDAIRLIHARRPDTPIYVLGESMGGAVVMVMLAKHGDALPVAGALLVAPAVWGREYMGPLQQALLTLTAHTIPGFRVSGAGLGIIASDNLEMLRALSKDPLVIKRTRIDAVWGLVNLMDAAIAAAPRLTVPTLLMYGLRDEIIPRAPTLGAIQELPEPPEGRWRVAVYTEGYHMLLRDLGAEQVVEDIVAWINDPDVDLPSGAGEAAIARLTARAED